MRYKQLAALLMLGSLLTAGVASAQTYDTGTSAGTNDTSGTLNTSSGAADSGAANTDNGTVLGTSTDPNIPNTGEGGNAATTITILTLSGLLALSGLYALRRYTLH